MAARSVTTDQVEDALALRREIHQAPDLSGHEQATAARVLQFFEPFECRVAANLGGHGVAFAFASSEPGPAILLRSELDALPINESPGSPHRSRVEGVGHQCGHDGHMAILALVGSALNAHRPQRGSVVLLFQPAEETGTGAAAVLEDPAFAKLRPDSCYALHNLPGFPLGSVIVRNGTFCCASRGITTTLEGRSAHAAQPETGASPATALAILVTELEQTRMSRSAVDPTFATVVAASLPAQVTTTDPAFGATPATGSLSVTLRSSTNRGVAALEEGLRQRAQALADEHELSVTFQTRDHFDATTSDPSLNREIVKAAAGRPLIELDEPMPFSEDFGRFSSAGPTALFGLGAGRNCPALHDESYQFPERLVPIGASILLNLVAERCG